MRRYAALFVCTVLSACSSWLPIYGPSDSAFIRSNYAAADHLLAGSSIDPSLPILVATVVNIDHLSESSRLGRTISEQVGSRIASRGYSVVELKLRDSLFVKQSQGELLLSRELADISQRQRAQAVVVGTYSAAGSIVYVNLKLIATPGNLVRAAYDYPISIQGSLESMLPSEQRGSR